MACEAPLVFERAVVVEAPEAPGARLRRAEAVVAELGRESLRRVAREAVPELGAGAIRKLSLEPRLIELPARAPERHGRAQILLQLRLHLRGLPEQAEKALDAVESRVRAELARQDRPPFVAPEASSGA